jgi:serine/threonine protein kinase
MEELARYAMQICRGLEYLHTKKLVHRDMKLENILVRLSLAL